MPHATRALWPIATPGSHGDVAPTTFQPGATRCTRYRRAGADRDATASPTTTPDADASARDGARVRVDASLGAAPTRNGGVPTRRIASATTSGSFARRISSSASPLSRNASVRFNRSAALQYDGGQRAWTNSSGRRARAIETYALTPRTNASAIALASGP